MFHTGFEWIANYRQGQWQISFWYTQLYINGLRLRKPTICNHGLDTRQRFLPSLHSDTTPNLYIRILLKRKIKRMTRDIVWKTSSSKFKKRKDNKLKNEKVRGKLDQEPCGSFQQISFEVKTQFWYKWLEVVEIKLKHRE